MVYRPLSERKAEQERAALERDWMTLNEAIELIESIDAESGVKAPPPPFDQICNAMRDGVLRARWLDEGPPIPPLRHMSGGPMYDNPHYYLAQVRTRPRRLATGGEIDWGDGWWRQLLLSREDMVRIFTLGMPTKDLRQLSYNDEGKKIINKAISEVYDRANRQGVRPPNIKEIVDCTLQYLKKYIGVIVPAKWIEELAADDPHRQRRGKPGKHSSLRPISELKI